MRARLCWCGTHFLAIEPALRAACTIWAAWPRTCHRALWRRITRLFGGSGAAAGAVHGGVAGLQYLFRRDRRVNAARRDARTGDEIAPAFLITASVAVTANTLSRNLPGAIRWR